MDFNRLPLTESLSVRSLISFHYFEYAKGFTFEGEQHDFWEFLYVDKGEVEVRADERTLELKQGMIVFHKPGEFHTVRVGRDHKPPNLIVIAFECASAAMERLACEVRMLGDRDRNLLSLILQEGFAAFEGPLGNPAFHVLNRRPDAPFAGEQLIRAYLEILMVRLVREREAGVPAPEPGRRLSSMQQEKQEDLLVRRLVAFMRERLSESLTLDDLCREAHLGKSRLKEIFRAQTGTGALDYFKRLKIEEARTLIREKQYNFTEIAGKLGYASLHYFSRDFKKATGMSPSDYARSAEARSHAGAEL